MLKSASKTFIEQTIEFNREKARNVVAEFYTNEDRYREPEMQVFHSYNAELRFIEKAAIVIKINGVCYRARVGEAMTEVPEETMGPVLSSPESWLVSENERESIAGEGRPSVPDYTLYYGRVGDGYKLRFNIEGVTYQLHKAGGGEIHIDAVR